MPPFSPDSSVVERVEASPNFDERTGLARPDMIVLHYTGMQFSQDAIMRLCDPKARVSSHYVVVENGAIVQLVPEVKRAWHAGISSWNGDTDINSRSIGIEICNPGHEFGYPDFPARQIAAVITLCRSILTRNIVRPENIVAHSDVAPSRKQDPGEKFPVEAARAIQHRAVGRAGLRSPKARCSSPTTPATRSTDLQKALTDTATASTPTAPTTRPRGRGYRIPAPLPPGESRRHHRRLDAGNAAQAAGRPRIRPPQKDRSVPLRAAQAQ